MASPFSGRAGRLAGIWAAGEAQKYYDTQSELLAQGQRDTLAALAAGRTNALGAIDLGKTQSLDELGRGRDSAIGAIDTGEGRSLEALGKGYDRVEPLYTSAISRLDPWAEAGKKALGTYNDSLGLNGQAGYDATVAAFRESPGYRYQVDQATDAVARKASAIGALGSGNTMQAIADRSRSMADAEFGGWQDRLERQSGQGMQAAGTQAGLQSSLAGTLAQRGRDEAGVISGAANNRASTFSNFANLGSNIINNAANATAGIHTGTSGQEAGAFTNFANLGNSNIANLANTVIGAGTGALLAGQQAAQNRLNFGMNLANLGAGLLGSSVGGGMGGLGQLGKQLTSFAYGGNTPGAGGLY